MKLKSLFIKTRGNDVSLFLRYVKLELFAFTIQ